MTELIDRFGFSLWLWLVAFALLLVDWAYSPATGLSMWLASERSRRFWAGLLLALAAAVSTAAAVVGG